MSAPPRIDGVPVGENPYASDNRWRHQESTKFAEHASPREAASRNGSNDLADFFNKSRVDRPPGSAGGSHKPIVVASNGHNGSPGGQTNIQHEEGHEQVEAFTGRDTTLDVACGPLLNYRRMEDETWFGSVLVVTKGGSGQEESPEVPELKLRVLGVAKDGDKQKESTGGPDAVKSGEKHGENAGYENTAVYEQGLYETDGVVENTGGRESRVQGTKLYSDPANTFWRFDLTVKMQQEELKCEYSIPSLHFIGTKTDKQHFFVPAIHDSMRIMFHSCNGFSVGTDEKAWSGAALWNDVLRVHAQRPFHVMLGGGDQIYNDGIRVSGPLKAWTDISSPHKRREFAFPESLRRDCADYYVNNYIKWYSTEPFAGANGQIAQLNLWDDHDVCIPPAEIDHY